MMIVETLHNPILGGGILLIAVSLYLQLTLQRRLDTLETRFKNSRLSSDQLDKWVFCARWLPVFCTVLGVVLLVWGFNEALEAAKTAELQGATSR